MPAIRAFPDRIVIVGSSVGDVWGLSAERSVFGTTGVFGLPRAWGVPDRRRGDARCLRFLHGGHDAAGMGGAMAFAPVCPEHGFPRWMLPHGKGVAGCGEGRLRHGYAGPGALAPFGFGLWNWLWWCPGRFSVRSLADPQGLAWAGSSQSKNGNADEARIHAKHADSLSDPIVRRRFPVRSYSATCWPASLRCRTRGAAPDSDRQARPASRRVPSC
jgi:hypothetical protein